jgi:hypothetical protein
MTATTFDVQKWATWQDPQQPEAAPVPQPNPATFTNSTRADDVESVISQLEAHRIDITGDYHDWLSIAFALVHEFGEAGRGYFHRVSRFHPGYRQSETDQQYSECLKRNRTGKSIRTFFWLASQYGVRPAKNI